MSQSSDGLTSMKEIMQTKTIPDSSPVRLIAYTMIYAWVGDVNLICLVSGGKAKL